VQYFEDVTLHPRTRTLTLGAGEDLSDAPAALPSGQEAQLVISSVGPGAGVVMHALIVNRAPVVHPAPNDFSDLCLGRAF
jgi:hypothetical protein